MSYNRFLCVILLVGTYNKENALGWAFSEYCENFVDTSIFLSTNVGDYGGLCECPAPGQQCRQLTEVSNQHRTISHYPWVVYVVTAELFTRSQIDRYIHLLSGAIVTIPLQSSPLIPPRHPQRQDDQEIPRSYREERNHARQNLPGRKLEAESRPDNCRVIFRGGGSCQLRGD